MRASSFEKDKCLSVSIYAKSSSKRGHVLSNASSQPNNPVASIFGNRPLHSSARMSTVKHTYGSRKRQIPRILPASPNTSPPTSPAKEARPSKRSFADLEREDVPDNRTPLFPPSKRTKSLFNKSLPSSSVTSKPKPKAEAKTSTQKTLTQLHFNIDQSILRTCSLCDLSYTKGASADEELHRAHCQRVKRDMVWGREEEKDRVRGSDNVISEVETNVKVKMNGKKKLGRIIYISSDVGGKLGTKVRLQSSKIFSAFTHAHVPALCCL